MKNKKSTNQYDVSKYKTKGGACNALTKALNAMGFNAESWNPAKSNELGYGKFWHCYCEDLPYEGFVLLSMGESMYCQPWIGPYNSFPEVILRGNENWYTEPQNNHLLVFANG